MDVSGHELRAAMVRERARIELAQEQFRARVEQEKVRLRAHRSLWDRLFPYTITRKKP